MNSSELALARLLFIRRVYESNGQAFQDLFVRIMRYADPSFTPVKPQGSIGDKKNDGYFRNGGRYFQVYAPEDAGDSETSAVKKARADFAGLADFWGSVAPITEWRFVLNDKFQGSFPLVEAELAEIKKDNPHLLECSSLLTGELEDVLFSLSDDRIQSVIGYIPNPESVGSIDYDTVNEVIGHLMSAPARRPRDPDLIAPDFDEKIVINGLTSGVASWLTTGSYQVGPLEDYFARHGSFLRRDVRDRLSAVYMDARRKHPRPIGRSSRGDLIFMAILDTIVPQGATQMQQNAAIVVMAYFFEACDIFESPVRANASA